MNKQFQQMVRLEFASDTRNSFSIILDSTETATLRHIFSDAAYFLIKSGNEENISLAKAKVKLLFNIYFISS